MGARPSHAGAEARATGGAEARATGGAEARATGGAEARATGGAEARATGGAEARATIRADLGEQEIPNEKAIIDDTVEVLRTLVTRKLESTGKALRDVHAKAHGCVNAKFIVTNDVPDELKHGIFARAGQYEALVRFSSAEHQPETGDLTSSVRGMGIRVTGVQGETFLREPQQDFLFNNRPAFPLKDIAEYRDAMKVRRDGAFAAAAFAATHLPAVVQLTEANRIESALTTTFWSQTPIAVGPHATKISARPCAERRQRIPREASDNYLRDDLEHRLSTRDACFDIMVQTRGEPALFPVEDASVVWDEAQRPPERVARLLIPKQKLVDDDACEKLQLNPWHALREHQPLGSLNRSRLAVYQALASFRAHPPGETAQAKPR
jgi:hypothetical protein